MDLGDLDLTDEELAKVNYIISGIQSDLDNAIQSLNKGDYDGALNYVNSGISRSNCPLCKRQLGLLIADINHNKAVCILDKEICKSEKEDVIKTAIQIKDEFVPVTTTKKALKDKKASMQTEKAEKKHEPVTIDEFIETIFYPLHAALKFKRSGED